MARVFAEHRPTAVLNLAAETHVDRSIDGPRPFIDTNIVGTFVLLEAARAFVGAARRRPRATRSAFCTCRPTRSTARWAPTGCSARRRPTRRTRRTRRARRRRIIWCARIPHLRPAGADHQLLEQLRTVSVSRKADPADDAERARRPAAADLRRRRQRARLAARRGPLRRASAGARQGPRRARSTTSAAATSAPTSRSSIGSATLPKRCVRRRRTRR